MGSALEFLWTAFRDYWKVWVTGTGTVGFFLFGLGLFERHRGKSLNWKIYTAILFCTFWFLGTFSAWHDSQKNLRLVIQQREHDTSSLGSCTSNLRLQTALKESWQERFADQQKTINALQGPELQQQATINSCVVSLGKTNPFISTKTSVVAFDVASSIKPSAFKLGSPTVTYFIAIVISTNRRTNFSGRLNCSYPFKIDSSPQVSARESNSGMYGTGSFTVVSDKEYVLANADTGGLWDAADPVYLTGESNTKVIGPCTFNLSQ